jgi:cytochrome oxidase Cu insertion factor (SCO1/SenC/PrrC family)
MLEATRLWRVRLGALGLLAWAARTPAWAATDANQPRPAGVRPRVDPTRLPAPGTYRLPRLFTAPDGQVIASDGKTHQLRALLAGRLSVLSFMYTYCRDPEGCPLAWRAMETVHNELLRGAALASRAQLLSLSFDPTNDTPAQMAMYGGERARDERVRWRFLTTASVPRLLPLLSGFGQDVSVETDARGRAIRTLNHLLKIFLIDGQCQVREVYSVATLAPEAIVNDLHTLRLEADTQPHGRS